MAKHSAFQRPIAFVGIQTLWLWGETLHTTGFMHCGIEILYFKYTVLL